MTGLWQLRVRLVKCWVACAQFKSRRGRHHTAQQRATLAVNRELVLLYWQIGRDILARQAAQGWGAKVIERLAHDLRAAFPEMKGFSPCNLQVHARFC